MTSEITATGQGKLIVFGEHAVVYGRPAIACGLPTGARATLRRSATRRWIITHPDGEFEADEMIREAGALLLQEFDLSPRDLDIRVDISIPLGAGLGSSAAMAVAVARCAAQLLDFDAATTSDYVARAVDASEGVFHGNASGIDQQAAMERGFFAFRKSEPAPTVESLDVEPHRWLLARVAPSASTAKMVRSVAARRTRLPRVMESLFDDMAAVAAAGQQALARANWQQAGELMDINQGLLNACGVSNERLEAACGAARRAGALGAKITGAGGGGCIVALVDDDESDVADALRAFGDVFAFTLPA